MIFLADSSVLREGNSCHLNWIACRLRSVYKGIPLHKLRATVDNKSNMTIRLFSKEVVDCPFVEYHAVTK